MLQQSNKALLAVLTAALLSAPALADVQAGVDAWGRGDYAGAVGEWEAPARAGDADALFNLGQAYRLGRGVPLDPARAESYYAEAAAKGHLQAADTYGLMLFQSGRKQDALPYLREAARRGDPRSQYLLGVAHFNGDMVERDWLRAYALMTLASGAGLPQAAPAMAEMDRHIPLAQRQQAASLAVQMRGEAEAALASELAAVELGNAAEAAPQVAAASSPRVPQPIATTPVVPSVTRASDAMRDARGATGTENPAQAGASYTLPGSSRTAPQVATARPESRPSPAPVERAPAVHRAPPAASQTGPWRIQLGAFAVAGNAEKLWSRLSGRAELAGRQRLLVPAGKVTKLQAGGFSRSAADAACRSLRQAGQDCLVTER